MKIWRSLKEITADPAPAPYVTVGTFDGVHLGHQALLRELKEMAQAGRGAAVVVTFGEAAENKNSSGAPQRLNYADERLELLAAAGADAALALPFDDELRRMAADQFVEEVLVGALHARGVCVGYDHHFGHDGRGDISLLSLLGKKYSFETHAAPPFAVDGMIVSSTLVRRKLRIGDVAEANKYLGYRYQLRGMVEKGSGVGGSELGYPTANVQLDAKMLPAAGVYAALGNIMDEEGHVAEGPFGRGRAPARGPHLRLRPRHPGAARPRAVRLAAARRAKVRRRRGAARATGRGREESAPDTLQPLNGVAPPGAAVTD